jgi:hypothetical protein
MTRETSSEPSNENHESSTAPILPHTRAADASEAPPPPASPNRGPMDQTTPDVATGSTPLTRNDD